MKIYTLDERCLPAMEKVREYYLSVPAWRKDVEEGKMFGVLIYGPTNEGPQDPPQGRGVTDPSPTDPPPCPVLASQWRLLPSWRTD